MPIGTGAAILAGAGIQGATSLAGGKKGASAATQAAQLQFRAAQDALAQQRGVLQAIQGEVQPFIDYGRGGIAPLETAMTGGLFTSPIDTTLPQFTFQPTAPQLEAFRGFQFIRDQSLKAAQNQLTAAGLGRSMSGVNTAANVATQTALGAAEQPMFNQAYQAYTGNVNALLAGRTMDLQQRQQIFNMLSQRLGVGLQ